MTARSELRADCARVRGLCCVVPAFTVSSDFAIDKPSGVACPNLAADDFGCSIHGELRERGFPGCTVYDCFGAGQRVVQQHFGGREWRTPRRSARTVRDVRGRGAAARAALVPRGRRLPSTVARRCATRSRGCASAVERAAAEPHDATSSPAAAGRRPARRGERRRTTRAGRSLRGHDLAGRDLRDEGLTDADLRGAVLLGTDLRGVDLGEADLLGADLRGADLRGTDLSRSLFLTRMQVRAGRSDETTLLPGWAAR